MRFNATLHTLYLHTLSENKRLKKNQAIDFRNTPFLTMKTTLKCFFQIMKNF